jgi:hypothetical protein
VETTYSASEATSPLSTIRWKPFAEVKNTMDVIFILLIIGLYAVTHWVTAAISRLGGVE